MAFHAIPCALTDLRIYMIMVAAALSTAVPKSVTEGWAVGLGCVLRLLNAADKMSILHFDICPSLYSSISSCIFLYIHSTVRCNIKSSQLILNSQGRPRHGGKLSTLSTYLGRGVEFF